MLSTPRILLIGRNGQVGSALLEPLLSWGDVIAHDRQTLDLGDSAALVAAIHHARPHIIINAAAYTQVDRAESERELAFAVNATAPGIMAREAAQLDAMLLHYSTDYVFDGTSPTPYREADPIAPQNVYGATKAAGDAAVLSSGADAYILRVAWVYSNHGRNFLKTVQRLLNEGHPLRIVDDQHGSPTSAAAIVDASMQLLQRVWADKADARAAVPTGVYHASASDYTSWWDFARAIALASAGVEAAERIVPISTAEFPTPAKRPAYSQLDPGLLERTFGIRMPGWREQLKSVLEPLG